MTVEEIALMREIVRWRRDHAVSFFARTGTAPGWVAWDMRNYGFPRRSVTIERGDRQIGETPDYLGTAYRWHAVDNLTQAVDLLVAYGYLPTRFSTAYRAGWDNAMDSERVGPSYGEVPVW